MLRSRRAMFRALGTGFLTLGLARARGSVNADDSLGTVANPTGASRVIEITAKRFSFAPDYLEIGQDEAVVLAVTALDFPHGFSIPALHLRATLVPGQVTRIALLVRERGTLDFLCDNFCGGGHEAMSGQIMVTAPVARPVT